MIATGIGKSYRSTARGPASIPYTPEQQAAFDKRQAEYKAQLERADNYYKEKKDKAEAFENKSLALFTEKAALNPPQYPISIFIKQYVRHTKAAQEYFLTDMNDNYLFASSFEDALATTKTELANPSSRIQKTNAQVNPGSLPLRVSASNKGWSRQMQDELSGAPLKKQFYAIEKDYLTWEMYVTNAPKSTMSSFRKSMQGRVKGGSSHKSKKSKKSKKGKKSKKNN